MIEKPRICPKCGSKRWIVTAHVTQNWEVNEYGSYIKTICDCVETTHSPDKNDVWCCAECGAEYDDHIEESITVAKSNHDCMCVNCPFCKVYRKGPFTQKKEYYCEHHNYEHIKNYFHEHNIKKMEGYIGFSKPDGEFPIKRTPKWCPRLAEEKEEL